MKSRKISIQIISFLLSFAMMIPLYTAKADANMKAGQECIELIKSVEGFSKYKYWDYAQWTIGYGTRVDVDEYPDGITEQEAEKLLIGVMSTYEGYVNKFANKYGIKLKQNQFDALVSLSYNMGNIWGVYDDFDLKNYIIDGSEKHSFLEIAKGFGEWRVAGGSVLQGLVSRREEETKLFLSDRTDSKAEVWRVNTKNGINLRKSAGATAEKTGFMNYNTIYEVTEKKTVNGSLWGKTYIDGSYHWCILDFSKYMVGGPIDYQTTEQPDGKTEKWRITSENGVNLREGPGLGYDSLDVLGYGTDFEVTMTAESDEHIWGKTKFAGKTGWIALTYAKRISGQEFDAGVLTEIYIKSLPNKIKYTEGDMLSLDGIVVMAKYSDNTEKQIVDFTADGYESKMGTHKIVLSYMGKTAEFTVSVSENKLKEIEVAQYPQKVVYKIGDTPDWTGLVVEGVYENQSRQEIRDYSLSGFESDTVGKKTINVEYKGFKTEFSIEVSQRMVKKILITKLPDKTQYVTGQELNLSGLTVCAVYDNGTRSNVTDYTCSGYDPHQEGVQTITVSYDGFEKSFEILVSEPDMYQLPGDLNDDGIRDIFDLILLNRLVNEGRTEFSPDRTYLADVNGDGSYDLRDIDALSRIVSEQ